MSSTTPKLGLTKPVDAEAIDVSVLNADFDAIDAGIGCLMVNPGVMPPAASLYDGCLVKEKGTGVLWVATKSGSTYVKSFIRYPYSGTFIGSNKPIPSDNAFHRMTIDSLMTGRGYGAVAGDSVGGGFVAPIDATYRGFAKINFAGGTGASGGYQVQLQTPTYALSDNLGVQAPGTNAALTLTMNFQDLRLAANDALNVYAQQSSGGPMNVDMILCIEVQTTSANR